MRCDSPGENGKRGYVFQYTKKGGFFQRQVGTEEGTHETTFDRSVGALCGQVWLTNPKDFAIGGFPVHRAMPSRGAADIFSTILEDEDVRNAVNQAAAQKGIDPRLVAAVKRAVKAQVTDPGNEGLDYSYELPTGYTLCRLRVSPLNMTGGGGRPAEFRIGFQPGGIPTDQRVYAWSFTPRNFNGATSRVNVVVWVVMVTDAKRDHYVSNGVCGDFNKKGESRAKLLEG